MKYKIYKLNNFVDTKGKLVPIEFKDYINFNVKRLYFVYENLMLRGGHCHLQEEEFFFMALGSCKCRLHDGFKEQVIELAVGENAIYVNNYVWHEFYDFSKDASLVALSSTNYNSDRNDYIEDFDKFLKHVQ